MNLFSPFLSANRCYPRPSGGAGAEGLKQQFPSIHFRHRFSRHSWIRGGILFFIISVDAIVAEETKRTTLNLGDRNVGFEIVEGTTGASPVMIVSLHSNEVTSRAVAKDLLRFGPGVYVGIEAGGDRRVNLRPGKDNVSIDPNRMFSKEGIERDFKRGGVAHKGDTEAVMKFADAYLQAFINRARVVVAVHNNTEGGYSILSYQKGGSEAAATERVNLMKGVDPDNFFLVTEKADFDALSAKGYNVVLQAGNAPDDGSLSVRASHAGKPYINVEAQSGAEEVQRKMLIDALQLVAR